MPRPKANRRNGSDRQDRLPADNPGGLGKPCGKRAAEIRAAMMDAVSEDDLRGIVRALVRKAKKGDTVAARLVLDWIIGKPLASVKVEEVPPEAQPMTPEDVCAALKEEYYRRHPEARAEG